MINCLAYIDLNPIRAGLVQRPEDYRWSGFGRLIQGGGKDAFVNLDFGLAEFDGLEESERLRAYRKFLYEIGGLERLKGASIPEEIVSEEFRRDYRLGDFAGSDTGRGIFPIPCLSAAGCLFRGCMISSRIAWKRSVRNHPTLLLAWKAYLRSGNLPKADTAIGVMRCGIFYEKNKYAEDD